MRIAVVYDCLFPNTVGGAERWYRNLAERLDGPHSITYLTRRQWGEEGPRTSFPTVAVSPGGELYASSGRRRIWPPIRFGMGIFWHLLRHGRGYDAVLSASFPYFSLLAAAIALRLTRSRARLIVDWHEVWGPAYWRSYLGPIGGRVGFAIERLCMRLPDRSFTFSRLAESRLRAHGHRAPIERLTGEFVEDEWIAGRSADEATRAPDPPVVVVAGRQIPEKRTTAIPPAIAAARTRLPELRCVILGDGPDAEATRALVHELGLAQAVETPGRVDHDEVIRRMASASCLLHPSEREGYGVVVVESVALGTPAVLAHGSENAATELIDEGVNGFVTDADPAALAAALVRAVEGGTELRASTLDWYSRHRDELSIERSLELVEASYA